MSALETPMSADEARRVTDRIRLLLGSITEATTKAIALIEQAEAGAAWQALGYDSWPAYVVAEFGDALAGLARAERIPITAKLSEGGMSTRAIATVVGVDHSQVVRDQQVVQSAPPEVVTGLDGKSYPRRKPTAADARAIGEAIPPIKRPKVLPYRESYLRALDRLDQAVTELQRLHHDRELARVLDAQATSARLRQLAEQLSQLAEQYEQVRRP